MKRSLLIAALVTLGHTGRDAWREPPVSPKAPPPEPKPQRAEARSFSRGEAKAARREQIRRNGGKR